MPESLLVLSTSLAMNRYVELHLCSIPIPFSDKTSQEHFRQSSEAQGYGYNITESGSSNIDDVTMHELYLWPFADAVRAGVGSVMW